MSQIARFRGAPGAAKVAKGPLGPTGVAKNAVKIRSVFKHVPEKHVSNPHFERKFTFILSFHLFSGMVVVAPGGTFPCQGREKVPGGVQQHMPKGCFKSHFKREFTWFSAYALT